MPYNEEYGPTTHDTDECRDAQSRLFGDLTNNYNLSDDLTMACDYFKVGRIDGIDYYAPNNEMWGSIIAVDKANHLATDTSFYEMDDMEWPGSDYAIVNNNGTLMCRWKAA